MRSLLLSAIVALGLGVGASGIDAAEAKPVVSNLKVASNAIPVGQSSLQVDFDYSSVNVADKPFATITFNCITTQQPFNPNSFNPYGCNDFADVSGGRHVALKQTSGHVSFNLPLLTPLKVPLADGNYVVNVFVSETVPEEIFPIDSGDNTVPFIVGKGGLPLSSNSNSKKAVTAARKHAVEAETDSAYFSDEWAQPRVSDNERLISRIRRSISKLERKIERLAEQVSLDSDE